MRGPDSLDHVYQAYDGCLSAIALHRASDRT
jgi:hypothetical protein